MELVIAGIVVLLVGGLIWANWSANYRLVVDTSLPPGDVRKVVESCFIARANTMAGSTQAFSIKPRLKKDAPTLHVEVQPGEGGATVRMAADYIRIRRGLMPWTPAHGTWIFRKQRKIARRLAGAPAAAGAPQSAA